MIEIMGYLEKPKRIITLACWRIIQWLNEPAKTKSNNFPDLTPTDNATNTDEYEDRLKELLVNRSKSVREIAVTSPYSGGKSSFINTYMRHHPYHHYTCISLVGFRDIKTSSDSSEVDSSGENLEVSDYQNDKDTESEINKIEKSIVQQILYRTKNEKAPNSRFRRIYPFPLSNFKAFTTSITIATWLLLIIYIYFTKDFWSISDVLRTTHSFSIENPNLWIYSFLISTPILIFRDAYKELHKFNITKINIPRGEFALTQKSNDSVFNIYLEEIIYYFATSGSDIVVFEDLDRLEAPGIFIKLKELNKLINDSADVNQSVRFLYALKDDVFKGNDRTKFFDSIIPIIPIATSSNSFPHLKIIVTESGFDKDFNDDFLKDIAVYLDDMRMLKNIVSEYGIYKATLIKGFPAINLEQLFSFIVYKNFYSNDFSFLHYGEGLLAEIFSKIHYLRKIEIGRIESEIKSLERRLIESENEGIESITELNSHYLLNLMEKINPNQGIIRINDSSVYELSDPKLFDTLLSLKGNLTYMHNNNGSQLSASNRIVTQWRDDTEKDYHQRKARILDKNNERKRTIREQIRTRRDQIEPIKASSLKDLLIRVDDAEIDDDLSSMPLLSHMIERGYIDEHYHLYISHFKEGNMTRSDMDYVMSVKNRTPLDRDHRISRASSTLEYLTDVEYRTIAFLNYDICNHLLREGLQFPLESLVRHGVKESEERFNILRDTLEHLEPTSQWIHIIAKVWPEACTDIAATSDCPENQKNFLLSSILSSACEEDKYILLEEKETIAKYISRNQEISSDFPAEEDNRKSVFNSFKYLRVSFHDLSGCENEISFVQNAIAYQLFDINENNLRIAFHSTGNSTDSTSPDYSKICRVEDFGLSRLVYKNIQKIAELISLNKIRVSKFGDFFDLLNNEDISFNVKLEIIKNVDFYLEDLSQIENEKLLTYIFSYGKAMPSWENISIAANSKDFDQSILISALSDNQFLKDLCSLDFELSDNDRMSLAAILIQSDIDVNKLDSYLSIIDYNYSVEEIEKADQDKVFYLIDTDRLDIGTSEHDKLRNIDPELSNYMIKKHFAFFARDNHLTDITLNSDSFYRLLEMEELSTSDKRALIGFRPDLISVDGNNLTLIDAVFDSSFMQAYNPIREIPRIPTEILEGLLDRIADINNKKQLSIGQVQYLSQSEIPDILLKIGGDFRRLASSRGHANIEYSKLNYTLCGAITHHGYTSSISVNANSKKGKKIIRVNHKR